MLRLLRGLKAAGEESRLRLLALCAEGELTESELAQVLGQSQPRVSRHLKLLCDAGLLSRFREGAWVFFRLADTGEGADLAHHVVTSLDTADPRLGRDRERLYAVKATRSEIAAAYFRANASRWDEIRALHVPDSDVERALLEVFAGRGVTDLLDVGTGTGRVLEVLGRHVERGIGIDLSREMLQVARTNLERAGLRNCYVRHADMYALPLDEAAVDAVTFHQVLHFASDPARAIAEAARTLKPGGEIVIVDFAPHALEHLRADHAHRRLGFSDDEVNGWLRVNRLRPEPARRFEGTPLTVVMWRAVRAGARAAGTVPKAAE